MRWPPQRLILAHDSITIIGQPPILHGVLQGHMRLQDDMRLQGDMRLQNHMQKTQANRAIETIMNAP